MGMKGKTPFEKLEEIHNRPINKNVVNFLVLMLKDLINVTKAVFGRLSNMNTLNLFIKWSVSTCQVPICSHS